MKCYKFEVEGWGGAIFLTDLRDVLEEIKMHLEEECPVVKISKVEMTNEEFESLPEFCP